MLLSREVQKSASEEHTALSVGDAERSCEIIALSLVCNDDGLAFLCSHDLIPCVLDLEFIEETEFVVISLIIENERKDSVVDEVCHVDPCE